MLLTTWYRRPLGGAELHSRDRLGLGASIASVMTFDKESVCVTVGLDQDSCWALVEVCWKELVFDGRRLGGDRGRKKDRGKEKGPNLAYPDP